MTLVQDMNDYKNFSEKKPSPKRKEFWPSNKWIICLKKKNLAKLFPNKYLYYRFYQGMVVISEESIQEKHQAY